MTTKTIRIIEELRMISDSEWEEIKKNLESRSEIEPGSTKNQSFDMENRQFYEREVFRILKDLGIPASIKGYNYIRSAVMHCIENPEMRIVTKNLYPTLAKEYETTPPRVERAIRHAIGASWDRADIEKIHEMFGHTYSAHRDKPTNAVFIATITDYILNS